MLLWGFGEVGDRLEFPLLTLLFLPFSEPDRARQAVEPYKDCRILGDLKQMDGVERNVQHFAKKKKKRGGCTATICQGSSSALE